MSSDAFTQKLKQATRYLDEAEALLIGAGAGLSAAAGFDFSDKVQLARIIRACSRMASPSGSI
ncbi:MAG: hypothetical protein NT121_20365 [Chloroflexi bacterium]|nr:hypothetical protein [Chloroflexota bacterium]